jgi:hypothetical protein
METTILVIHAIFPFQFLLVISNKGTNGFGVHQFPETPGNQF